MKKIIIAVLCMLLTAGALAGCGEKNKSEKNADLSIVATIFPGYDWVREIMGDEAENADITMLMDNGTDLHSYQPTADDIIKISKCDLFIYAGGESDEWVKDALKQAENKDMKVINMMEKTWREWSRSTTMTMMKTAIIMTVIRKSNMMNIHGFRLKMQR